MVRRFADSLGSSNTPGERARRFWWDRETLGPCQRFITAIREIILPKLLVAELAGLRERSRTLTDAGAAPALVIFVDGIGRGRSLAFSTMNSLPRFGNAIPEDRRIPYQSIGILPYGRRHTERLDLATRGSRRSTSESGLNWGFRGKRGTIAGRRPGRFSAGSQQNAAPDLFLDRRTSVSHQRLCYAVASTPGISENAEWTRCVMTCFFEPCPSAMTTCCLCASGFCRQADLINLLRLYRRVHRSTHFRKLLPFRLTLRRIEPVADEEANPLVGVLRLSGVAKVEMAFCGSAIRFTGGYSIWRGWRRICRSRIVATVVDSWGAIKRAGKFIAAVVFFLVWWRRRSWCGSSLALGADRENPSRPARRSSQTPPTSAGSASFS